MNETWHTGIRFLFIGAAICPVLFILLALELYALMVYTILLVSILYFTGMFFIIKSDFVGERE